MGRRQAHGKLNETFKIFGLPIMEVEVGKWFGIFFSYDFAQVSKEVCDRSALTGSLVRSKKQENSLAGPDLAVRREGWLRLPSKQGG